MTEDAKSIDDTAQYSRVARSQLASVLSNITVTLVANMFIAASAAAIIYHETGQLLIFGWLAMAVLFGIWRLAASVRFRQSVDTADDPHAILRTMTALAFVGGMVWVPLPVFFTTLDETRATAYIVFIMGGLTTGAIIQSLAYWRLSIAFGAPLMTATLVKLVLNGQVIDYIVASNLLLLTTMLFRVAIQSEENFRTKQRVAIEATDLARSLQVANDEIRQANDTLRSLAQTDALTGLANRSVFNQRLTQAVHDGLPRAIVLFDVDHFKSINDQLGHLAGDDVLNAIALIMMGLDDRDATPIRLGGDEFVIVLTGSACGERARTMANSLSQGARHIPLAREGYRVTLSIGVCVDEAAELSAVDLYAEADRALYAVKASGRDGIREARPASKIHAAERVRG